MNRIRVAAGLAVPTIVATVCLAAASSAAATHFSTDFTPSAGPSRNAIDLEAVSAAASKAAWAVGVRTDPKHPHQPGHAVVERWNGKRWSTAPAPKSAAELTSVSARSPHDVWAAGVIDQINGSTRVWHLHHGRWSSVSAHGLPAGLTATIVTAGSHVWLAGQVDPGRAHSGAVIATYRPAHHNWQTTVLSKVGGFYGAARIGAKSVYAVGSTSQFNDVGHPVVAHWNGTAWHATVLHSIHGQLTGVAGHSNHDVIAVGTTTVPSPPATAPLPGGLSLHWNGQVWKQLRLNHPTTKLFGAVTTGPGREYWAASGNSANTHAIYERYQHGKWSRSNGSKQLGAGPAGTHPDFWHALGLAHVPHNRLILSVGYGEVANDSGFFYPAPIALREMTTS